MNVSVTGVADGGPRHVREERPAVAWAESPLQLLCVVEARHAGLVGPGTRVVCRAGLAALRRTRAELRRLDLPDGLELATADGRMPRPRRGATWVFGDAFSGRVQVTWLTGAPGHVVLVDDGLATVHLLELLVADHRPPLLRARARAGLARRTLGRAAAARLRAAARAGRLTVFTALPVPERLRQAAADRGATIRTHDFGWLRAQPVEHPPPPERTVVLGTSLVRNGLVRRDRYLDWLARLGEREPIAYYPHRREEPADLARIGDLPGIALRPAGAPVEMTLRALAPGQRVLSLPSTAVTSLRVLLAPRGVRVDAVEVPGDWWTPLATPDLRSHLQMFTRHHPGVTD
ncbi:hypothetical protein GCM10010106_05140 [Thermopolyspora flexuosa]|uniref:Uncharacterized protein n=1 Tax=Thermopolyspora flexuosa TaxID=103836 RepID=A0A543IYY9_9ACTN|nr:hypothetical protein [Thermopolyspora flexuosa]TQM75796.1 hypothetical protein FHX40_2514 [Thermopolyspora flexuosa]GGM62120.1 hypothetical protein GCM10010106_05140 [Thermopolyspora flexuosa]